jgi:hypothetical protein
LNGIREVLTIVAIVIYLNKVFAEGNEELAEEHIQIFKRYAIIFLVAQLPVAFYQYAIYGPSDAVGGTLGNKGSGVLTLTVVCLVFFLAHYTSNISRTILLYFCLVPLLLNETKVSFILIPLLVLFIHFQPKLKNILLAIFAAALFLFLFSRFYSHSALTFDNNLTDIFSSDFLDDYLFGDIYYSDDVPRFTKIFIGWQLLSEQTNTFLFGFQYGLFKGGNFVEHSQFAMSYYWLLGGTRPYVFFLMLQGGIMLVAGILMLVLYINKFFRANNNKFKTFLFLIFLIMMFYNDSLRNQNFIVVFFFLEFYANSDLYNKNQSI